MANRVPRENPCRRDAMAAPNTIRACCFTGELLNVASRLVERIPFLLHCDADQRPRSRHILLDCIRNNGFAMRAFKFLTAALMGLIVVAWSFALTPAATQAPPIQLKPANGVQQVSLRDRLVVGLQARLKSEIAFCELVVVQVHLGHLPLRVVDETFLWARQRAAPTRNGIQYRPIVYFKPAMIARAKRLRVNL
jgi:hypothetical protein